MFASGLFFLGGYFWVGGMLQIVLLGASIILGLTAILGFCPIYRLFGLSTAKGKHLPRIAFALAVVVFHLFLLGGSYASDFLTRKIFIEDYNAMNQYYKQTLFFTGQEKRDEANTQYAKLVPEFAYFKYKYTNYHPSSLRSDEALNDDLVRVSDKINMVRDQIVTGDLKSAHVDLEAIRPIFQDILKRNQFSLLAISLVDFHDAMEVIIARADAHDAPGVIASYEMVSEKLKAVEAEANDAEIQAIRSQLESLRAKAIGGNTDALSAEAALLKSSFVKVYLKRG